MQCIFDGLLVGNRGTLEGVATFDETASVLFRVGFERNGRLAYLDADHTSTRAFRASMCSS